MGQLGYKFNKEVVTFDKEQCIADHLEMRNGKSGIKGCVFWMRDDGLQKTEQWSQQYDSDEDGCLDGESIPEKDTYGNDDKHCSSSKFFEQKRKQDWSYLTSSDRDGYFQFCADQLCPDQKVIK